MLKSDIDRFMNWTAPLTFGVFSAREYAGRGRAEGAGSGVFVAPFLALTARHVVEDLLQPKADEQLLPPPERFGIAAFQFIDPHDDLSATAWWRVDEIWAFGHTDLALLRLTPNGGLASTMQYRWPSRFAEISLLPPSPGTIVQAFGYPCHTTSIVGDQVYAACSTTFSEGRVVAVHSPYRDRGLMAFPCFEIEMRADHGFSGGPVFADGKLCGIVSAGRSFEETTYAASLWPIIRTEIEWGGRKGFVFIELAVNGFLAIPDWAHVSARIMPLIEDDREYLTLAPQTA